ncbi:MAG: DNA polymerase III subunit delta [Candidatus Mycalebacterium zealandia]|nr:MAG: DNA polymerase III subunit delta [Candidatus Mycalebacterium zealandia]
MKSEENTSADKLIFLVRGRQTLLADRFVQEVSKRFLGSDDSGEVLVFYADETPVSEVLANAANLSMFSSKKVVVLKRAEAIDKQSLELIKTYAAAPSAHVCLFLVSGVSSKPDLKETDGVFIKSVEQDPRKIHEMVSDEAGRMGFSMTAADSKYLCALTGEDLSMIRSELAKLAEIHPSGTHITRKEIDEMLNRRKTRDVFELTNAIVNGEKNQALTILAEISSQNQIEPLFILSAVSSRIRNVLKAAEIRSGSRGKSPEEQKKLIAKELKIKSGAAHFIWQQSRNFTQKQSAGVLKSLAETDRALKTSSVNGYGVIARMTVNLLA